MNIGQYAPAITLALLCGTTVACTPPLSTNEKHWRAAVAKVRIGMSRKEVEKLLPPYFPAPSVGSFTGSRQGITYWVDEEWCVSCGYDYTGATSDETGSPIDDHRPENKLLSMPRLIRSPCPPPIKLKREDLPDPPSDGTQ
jgi:hypothetical protein